MSSVFATGPVHLDEDGEDLRRDVGRALSDALGEAISVEAAPSYAHLRELVVAKKVAIAWMPPALFVRAHAAGAIGDVLRAERFGGGTYQGAIFVRDGSPFWKIEDLRGARMAWVDRDSCAGYLFPRLALREKGIDPDAYFASSALLESHSRVVRAVAQGTADAGATYVELADASDPDKGLTIAGWSAFAERKAMRPVLVSRSIPSDAICIGASVDAPRRAAWREKLAAFHLRPGGARLLRALLGSDRLAAGDPADYAPVRAALEDA
jgi:phosphonate transport system substrate-binding protein